MYEIIRSSDVWFTDGIQQIWIKNCNMCISFNFRHVKGNRYIRKCVIGTNIAETSVTVPQVNSSYILVYKIVCVLNLIMFPFMYFTFIFIYYCIFIYLFFQFLFTIFSFSSFLPLIYRLRMFYFSIISFIFCFIVSFISILLRIIISCLISVRLKEKKRKINNFTRNHYNLFYKNEKVRFVVDSGYVKQSAYDPVRHMDSLVIVPISQVIDQN